MNQRIKDLIMIHTTTTRPRNSAKPRLNGFASRIREANSFEEFYTKVRIKAQSHQIPVQLLLNPVVGETLYELVKSGEFQEAISANDLISQVVIGYAKLKGEIENATNNGQVDMGNNDEVREGGLVGEVVSDRDGRDSIEAEGVGDGSGDGNALGDRTMDRSKAS